MNLDIYLIYFCFPQYTSFIFYHDEEQKEAAEKTFKEQESQHRKSLVTVVRPAVKFYDAEE